MHYQVIFGASQVVLVVKNLLAIEDDMGSIPELGRSPRAGNCNLLQYSCLEISMAEELLRLQSWGCKESKTTESSCTHTYIHM